MTISNKKRPPKNETSLTQLAFEATEITCWI